MAGSVKVTQTCPISKFINALNGNTGISFTCRIDEKPQDLDRLLLILVVAESVLVASDRDFLERSLIAVLFVSAV